MRRLLRTNHTGIADKKRDDNNNNQPIQPNDNDEDINGSSFSFSFSLLSFLILGLDGTSPDSTGLSDDEGDSSDEEKQAVVKVRAVRPNPKPPEWILWVLGGYLGVGVVCHLYPFLCSVCGIISSLYDTETRTETITSHMPYIMILIVIIIVVACLQPILPFKTKQFSDPRITPNDHVLGAAAKYTTRLLQILKPTIKEVVPAELLSKDTRKGRVTELTTDDNMAKYVQYTVNKAWKVDSLRQSLLSEKVGNCAGTHTKITNKNELVSLLLSDSKDLKNASKGEYRCVFHQYLIYYVRGSGKATCSGVTPMEQAQENEKNGFGPFRSHNRKKRSVSVVKEMKESITDLVTSDGHLPEGKRMTKEEATEVVVDMLRQHGKQYLHILSVKKMTTLVIKYVTCENDRRKRKIQNQIDQHIARVGRSANNAHDQERNEVACHLDYIIKVKASINRAIELLTEGKAIYLDLYDDEFSGTYMTDLYVLAPENLKYEICQGAARKLIGKYERYRGHSKSLTKNRHLVGLFTARVFDLQAPQAIEKSTSKGSRGKVVGGYGVPLYGNNIMRELSYGDEPHERSVNLPSGVLGAEQHHFRLHRLIAIVAANYGFTIFEDRALEKLELDLRGRKYDEYIAYRSKQTTWQSVFRSRRTGDVHSRQCDVDHRAGRDLRHLDGLLQAAYTSHRMNTCYINVRTDAGHWCCGCEIMAYVDGNVSSLDNHEYFPAIDELYPQGINEAHDEDYLRELKETDPFEFLPPLTAPWKLEWEDDSDDSDSDDSDSDDSDSDDSDSDDSDSDDSDGESLDGKPRAEPQAEQVDPQESTGKRRSSSYSLRNIRPRR